MSAFPTQPWEAISGGGIKDPLLEDDFGTGDEAARPEFSSPTHTPMTLTQSRMTPANLASLTAFHASTRGLTFDFVHPYSGLTLTCRWVTPPDWKISTATPGRYSVSCTIKEV